MKEKNGIIPRSLQWIFTIIASGLFIIALWLLFCKIDSKGESLITTFILIAIGLIAVSYIRFSKITAGGFSIELEKEVKEITRRQLTNTVVKRNSTQELFWIDEDGNGHHLPDEATADFLSRNKGIIKEEMKEVQVKNPYPSITQAKVLHAGEHYFIEYNGTIYYQSGMAWIYKIAALKNINITDNKGYPESWKANDEPWITEIEFGKMKQLQIKNM